MRLVANCQDHSPGTSTKDSFRAYTTRVQVWKKIPGEASKGEIVNLTRLIQVPMDWPILLALLR